MVTGSVTMGRRFGFLVLFLAHRFTLERDAVRAVYESIEDGVGDGRVVEPRVLVIDRQLAGDDGRLADAAIVDDFEQVVARRLIERGHAPVVEDQHVDARELCEQ